jgi:hypothetical protein
MTVIVPWDILQASSRSTRVRILSVTDGPGGPPWRMKVRPGRPATSASPGANEPDYQAHPGDAFKLELRARANSLVTDGDCGCPLCTGFVHRCGMYQRVRRWLGFRTVPDLLNALRRVQSPGFSLVSGTASEGKQGSGLYGPCQRIRAIRAARSNL